MENDGTDSFLLQVKTYESNYSEINEKENISPNLHRPAAHAARIFWVSETALARNCLPMVISIEAKRGIVEIISYLEEC